MTALADRLVHYVRLFAASADNAIVDAGLLTRFLTGHDPAAFEALVARHGAMVLQVCRRILGDRHDAEDAFQATFLVLARKAGSVRSPGALAAWLHGVACHVALAARASARRRRQAGLAPAADVSDPRPDPLAELTASEALAVLEEEVQRLPKVYRLPMVLCCLHGLSQDEAAKQLGWTPGSVKGRLERGRRLLHRRLASRGLGLTTMLALVELARGEAIFVTPALAATTVRVAFAAVAPFSTGSSLASAAVLTLARSGVKSGVSAPAKLSMFLLFAVMAATVGLALAAQRQSAQDPPSAAQPREPGLEAQAKIQGKETQPRTDRHGDPLPNGALVRLGTLAFRAPNLHGIGFRKNNELVALGNDLGLHTWPADDGPNATTALLTSSRHYGPGACALSPDAHFAAGLVADQGKNRLVVWDLSGDKPAEYISRQIQNGYPLAFSANGEWLAVNDTGADKKVSLLLCRLPTKAWKVLPLEARYIISFSFTANGEKLAVETDKNVVVVFDTAQKKELQRVKVGNPQFAALSPDGQTLAILPMSWIHGPDQVLRLFAVDTGRELKALTLSSGSSGSARWVGFSPDGKTLWAGGNRELRAWDPASGKLIREIAGPAGRPLVFSADGRRLATHSDSAVMLWDLTKGEVVRPDLLQAGHTGAIMGVTVSPDGKVIATDGLDGDILLWDAAGRPLGRVRSSWGTGTVVFLPDSKTFITVADDWVAPVLCEAASGKELRRFTVPPDVAKREITDSLHLSADGGMLTTVGHPTSADQKAYVVRWDVRTGKLIDRTERAVDWREYDRLTYSPDGLWEVESGAVGRVGEKEKIQVVPDGESDSMNAQFGEDSRLVAMSRVPREGRGLSKGPKPGSLMIYDLNARMLLRELPTGRPLRHAFAPGGRQVAVCTREEIGLWDIPSGKKVWSVPQEHGALTLQRAMAFTPDGRRLITGEDCTALVWDLTKPGQAADQGLEKLPADKPAQLWDALAGEDAAKAYLAGWQLVDRPAQTVTLIRDRLAPVKAADPAAVRALVAKLDAEAFAEREEATKELRKLGETALPGLLQALKEKLPLEQDRRVRDLVSAITDPTDWPGHTLRQVRAISVLERTATPDARKLLAELAAGVPEARLTREAAAAGARLGRLYPGR